MNGLPTKSSTPQWTLLSDDDPAERQPGARVPRELGPSDEAGLRPFTARAIPALVDRLGEDSDPQVLGWLISALGYNGAREALQGVLPFADHPYSARPLPRRGGASVVGGPRAASSPTR